MKNRSNRQFSGLKQYFVAGYCMFLPADVLQKAVEVRKDSKFLVLGAQRYEKMN